MVAIDHDDGARFWFDYELASSRSTLGEWRSVTAVIVYIHDAGDERKARR